MTTAKECEYQKASSILNAGDYDSAKKIFDNLSGYNDADDMSKECEYRKAMLLYDGNDYETAKQIFESISGYKNSADMSKGCDYQKAVGFYDSGDYINAVSIFCTMCDFSNSKQYMYSIFKKLLPQTYVDKCTKALDYLNDYIESQKASVIAWALALRMGKTDKASWSPDTEDADLLSMLQCMQELNSMKNEYSNVFSKAVLDACNDETLSSANEKFIKLHSSVSNIFTKAKAVLYVNDMIGGSTSTMEKDFKNVGNAMSEFTAIYNSIQ